MDYNENKIHIKSADIKDEAQRLVDFVKEKDSSWDFGKLVKPRIIAEAYKSPGVYIKD